MIIKEGYWNYNMVFRINKPDVCVEELFEIIKNGSKNTGVVSCAYKEGYAPFSKEATKILQKRQENMKDWIDRINPEEDCTDEEMELYSSDVLPEEYFDFKYPNDLLELVIREHSDEINQRFQSFKSICNNQNNCPVILSLIPIKMSFSDTGYIYCPIDVIVHNSGLCMLTFSAKLLDVDADDFSCIPLKRWYDSIRVYDTILSDSSINNVDSKFKIIGVSKKTHGEISDIVDVLMEYIKHLFDHYLSEQRSYTCFESILIEQADVDIKNKNDNRIVGILNNILYPIHSFENNNDLDMQFAMGNSLNLYGLKFFKGFPARLVVMDHGYLENVQNKTAQDINRFFKANFELYVFIALCKKEVETATYTQSFEKKNSVIENIIKYNSDLVLLEDIMYASSYSKRLFYQYVNDIIENTFENYSEKIKRLELIENSKKELRNRRISSLLQIITLIFTAMFGLPAITQTIKIIRSLFDTKQDLIPFFSVSLLSVVIWALILFVISVGYFRLFRKEKQ